MPHAPTKDVTTTETIEDKDVMITKVTRDHDELGQHTHSEVVDKVTPGGHTHTEATDIEKDDGEHVHREVVDRDGAHGEHVHQTLTVTDKGERHVEKVCTDTEENGKHVHEEEKSVVNATQRGDGTVRRVVKDKAEPGFQHHEEVTTIEKESGTSTARHTVDDVNVDGMHIHEVSNSIEAGGSSKEMHTLVTDKDTSIGHVHTEQVERLSDIQGDKRAVVDSKVEVEGAEGKRVDVMHQEVTKKGDVITHHVECDKTVDGTNIHEIKDSESGEDGVQKQHVVVTDKEIPSGHIHTETVQQSTTNDEGAMMTMDEKVVVERNNQVTTDTSHKEATIRVDPNAGLVVTQHVENERDVGGAHIHEEMDTVQIAGGVGHVRTVVSDKDIPAGHIHTEKIEQVTVKEGVEKRIVDEAVVIENKGGVTLDVTHTEETNDADGPHVKSLHHAETAKIDNGVMVHEVADSVQVDGESRTTEVIVTEQETDGTHVYTETVKYIDADPSETTTAVEAVVVKDNMVQHSETIYTEQHRE